MQKVESVDKLEKIFTRLEQTSSKETVVAMLCDMINELGYTVVEENSTKPWGAYFRLSDDEIERFLHEFFPGLSLNDARLGHDDTQLSPKFLLVAPGQRLSWQLHHRRAERWRFLSRGAYHVSQTDDPGQLHIVSTGKVLQIIQGERHRLCSPDSRTYTLVAEVWQHTDPAHASDEDDIIRLEDDYGR